MGQRHQVYAIFNGQRPYDRTDDIIVALHHQWLYGRTALKLLANTLELDRKAGKYGPFKSTENAKEALISCYSTDVKAGYFHNVHDLEGLRNPNHGDNNDGITIIDFRGAKPKYCFMALEGSEITEDLPTLKPLTALEYVRHYYHPECYAYKQNSKNIPRIEKEIVQLIKSLSRYEIISLREVQLTFPEMFKKETEAKLS